MQIPTLIVFTILHVFNVVNTAVIEYSSSSLTFSNYNYGDVPSEKEILPGVVGGGSGEEVDTEEDPFADLDAEEEEEVLTTEITELTTAPTTEAPTPTTTKAKPQIRVRIPQTCCELGALAARQGYSCRPESHREKLRAQYSQSARERLGNHLYKTKNVHQAAREDHRRVEAQLRNFSKCVTGLSEKMEEDFKVCCKRTSIELFDEEPKKKQSSRGSFGYLHYK